MLTDLRHQTIGARTHAAVLLAAGSSRRLGRPKQLLTRDGETLVHRAARLAVETQPQVLLVVLGAGHNEVGAQLQDLRCELLANSRWQEGIASSLRIAARRLRGANHRVLILGCDQPALEATHLKELLHRAAQSPSGCAATLHAGAPGIPAVVAPELFATASRLRGDRGLGARLANLPGDSVHLLRAPSLTIDIDDDADLQNAIVQGLLDRCNR